MDGFFTFICLIVIFGFGFALGFPGNQTIIDSFEKAPVCIEQKVGTETIKNCYTLQKVTK